MATRTRTALLGAGALAVAVTVAAVGAPRVLHRHVKAPVDPTLHFTQDPAGVHLTIHNNNKDWGIRHQHLLIQVKGDPDVGFLFTFGPDGALYEDPRPGHPPKFPCCEITLLPPRGDYTFDLVPTKYTVRTITLILRGGDGWVRM